MARTALADRATETLRHVIAGHGHKEEAEAFDVLIHAIRVRLRGDRRAERVLAAVEGDPTDDDSGRALADELSYYAEVDPDFNDRLDGVIRRIRTRSPGSNSAMS